ncbi:uncharacterized protein LOC143294136 [Babylonia areolata]|uniref:uncharacterized protein LOC143294136 n=1 Tax=Babylonia areolata TaxID=304850 RepID=UPI003FCF9169
MAESFISAPELNNNSGLGASRVHPAIVYGHNDEDVRDNRIYAINSETGHVVATMEISGATNIDWEDLSVGPCGPHMRESSCIYIADIGGNHDVHTIYKVQEPDQLLNAPPRSPCCRKTGTTTTPPYQHGVSVWGQVRPAGVIVGRLQSQAHRIVMTDLDPVGDSLAKSASPSCTLEMMVAFTSPLTGSMAKILLVPPWSFWSYKMPGLQFGNVRVMGQVSSAEVDENSGLAASRLHPGILYGQNDHGDTNRIFAMDPVSGDVKATLTIQGVTNHDWEDLCVGTCGRGDSGTCIYIADIGDKNGQNPRQIYKVREPQDISDATLPVVDTYKFTWSEDDAESLMIDQAGDLYIISKVHGGDALFAKLPPNGWGSAVGVKVGHHDTVRLGLQTTHNDPQGADLSPDGRNMLVKTEEGLLLYQFSSSMDYVAELSQMRGLEVSTYVRRVNGEAVAWNVEGTGFYTLPEGLSPVFNYYTVTGDGAGGVIG